MAVFISYSHSDADFVDSLAANLFKAKTYLWVDRWELNVGDSLIRRIEDAITKASAIVFVLSKASVASEWCRKELTAGLVRELEERRVLVLPLLLEDCDVPLFLRDKKFADFRHDFDAGLRDIVTALARVTTDTQGRVEEVGGYIDWSTDWELSDSGIVTVELVAVGYRKDQPYTVLSVVEIELNERASQRHLELVRAGFEPFARQLVLACLADVPVCDDFFIYLKNAAPVKNQIDLRDPKAVLEFKISSTCRRLGADTGKDLVLDLGKQIRGMADQSRRVLEPSPSQERTRAMQEIMLKYRPTLPFGDRDREGR